MSGKVVGIDLGTSNSVVAAVVNGQPIVIPDEDGHRLQPSVVSFLQTGEVVVGPKARSRKVLDPVNTVYSVKRFIGRPFYSDEVRVAQTHYPYQVICGRDNNPKVFVQQQEYSPEEISAMVLRRMKTIAERYLGQRVERAVITVPANFNDAQRYATKAAGEIAGLEVLRILNEPTAAALAYGYGRQTNETVAIYDFGGGTFDITLLSLRDSVFEVLSTAGDTYLGGDDFDNRLVDYMVAAFQHAHGYDLSRELIAIQRLKNIAERLKQELSVKERVAVHIKEIIPGSVTPVVLSFSISRDGFNERCGDIIKRSFFVCDEALRLSRVHPSQIDHVVLVGGSTRIPLVRQMVSQYFSKEPVGDINPDEVVAVGAAIYGASLDQQLHTGPPPIPTDAQWASAPTNMVSSPYAAQDATQGIASPYAAPLLLDVTPQALGVATAGGYCDILIARNENIPTERKRVFTTSKDQQDTVRLQIMEGDSKKAEENYKLGELILSNLRPADRGDVSIEVTFEIDTNGILNVSATDKATRRTQRAQLNLSGAMSDDQIQALIARQRGIVMTDLPQQPGEQP